MRLKRLSLPNSDDPYLNVEINQNSLLKNAPCRNRNYNPVIKSDGFGRFL